MQNPVIAVIVADSLMAKLSRYMADYYTSKTRQDLRANTVMLEEAKAEYYRADNEYAVAVDQNLNLVSLSSKIKVERLRNERDIAFQIYHQLATQVELNKIKLQEETPILTVIEPARVPSGPASPNKMMIMLGFTFLFGFVTTSVIVVKSWVQKQKFATLKLIYIVSVDNIQYQRLQSPVFLIISTILFPFAKS